MVPELTKEQRIANLEKAKQMRKERTELRSQLASGVLTVCDLINLAGRGDKAASGLREKQMIIALQGSGFKKTQALMHALSIADSKRVGGLGVKQAHALIEKLDGVAL